MKRLVLFFLLFALLSSVSLADPLPLLEDYAEDISEPYDEADPSAGTFVYSCRYPHVDENAEGGAEINAFYDYLLNDTVNNMVPMIQDAGVMPGQWQIMIYLGQKVMLEKQKAAEAHVCS